MPRLYRLDDVRLRCQRRSDKENDDSISIPEWNALISEKYGELYSEVEKTGMRHFESVQTITATGAASYTVNADHLSTIVVQRVLDAQGHVCELEELMMQEETRWAGQTGDAVAYTIIGDQLTLYPAPPTGTYRLRYMPQAPDLSTAADSTQVDLVNADGEAFLIYGVAVAAKDKGEADAQLALKLSEAARDRFIDWCRLKAFTQPRRPIVRRSVNGMFDSNDYRDDPGGWWDRR